MAPKLIHRHTAHTGGTPVNAYVIESPTEVVVVDATLAVPDGRALGERVRALGKPLAGVVITHAHPDHYGGLVELLRVCGDVPVFATEAVIAAIRRDDPVKEQILRPMFGDAWAAQRAFPDTAVADGATLTLSAVELHVTDLGPGESPADSLWTLDDTTVFSADVAYDRHHCYLADGFHTQWLANLDRVAAALPVGATLHPGHGEPCGLEVLAWQRGYLETMLEAMERADWSAPEDARATVAARMRAYLPSEELAFLMELSIDPLAAQLAAT
jgi:glyoxylase-like metal-dependent hydrolase (beta-lactamase superfamily II)